MWFRKQSPGGLSRDELAELQQASVERAEDTLRALQQNQLPRYIQTRIQQQRAASLPWTSGLSVNEWLVFSKLKLKPLGLVAGSCFYHIGYSMANYAGAWYSRDLSTQEQALMGGRRTALERMQQEAIALGAHAVVGVQLKVHQPGFYGHETEFIAIGTAIAVAGLPAPERPLICTVTGEDFLKLLQVGSIPIGVALGACVHYQYTSRQDQFQATSFWNAEVPTYSEAIYHTRDRAVKNMWDDARHLGASGVLAHDTKLRVMDVEVERGQNDEREDHIVEFLSIGTAVSTTRTPPRVEIETVLELHDWNA